MSGFTRFKNPIPITPTQALRLSVWGFDKLSLPDINAGETAYIVGYWVAHATNPLYQIQTERYKLNRQGQQVPIEFACHRSYLVECRALEE